MFSNFAFVFCVVSALALNFVPSASAEREGKSASSEEAPKGISATAAENGSEDESEGRGEAEAEQVAEAGGSKSMNDGEQSSQKRNRKSCAYTFRNVKKYLKDNNSTKDYLPGSCAWQAGDQLLRAGFKKSNTTNPAYASEGEVCVFNGGKSICLGRPVGTVLVKTKSGWYDGCSNRPPLGYKFSSCYKK
jgi:hypothetical protein